MRSGSTLLEQILASHSAVCGLGEDSVFGAKADGIVGAVSGAVRSGSLAALAAAAAASAEEVVAGMLGRVPTGRRGAVTRVVDKQLFNFKHLGLLHLVLPDAPVLETTRNFMDVVFSIYRHNFNEVRWWR